MSSQLKTDYASGSFRAEGTNTYLEVPKPVASLKPAPMYTLPPIPVPVSVPVPAPEVVDPYALTTFLCNNRWSRSIERKTIEAQGDHKNYVLNRLETPAFSAPAYVGALSVSTRLEVHRRFFEECLKHGFTQNSYMVSVIDQGRLKYYPRVSMPCLGEMTYYPQTSPYGEVGYNHYRPNDLWRPYPLGLPVDQSLVLGFSDRLRPYLEWLTDPEGESPFRIIKGIHVVSDKSMVLGVVATDPDAPSDLVQSYFRYIRCLKGRSDIEATLEGFLSSLYIKHTDFDWFYNGLGDIGSRTSVTALALGPREEFLQRRLTNHQGYKRPSIEIVWSATSKDDMLGSDSRITSKLSKQELQNWSRQIADDIRALRQNSLRKL